MNPEQNPTISKDNKRLKIANLIAFAVILLGIAFGGFVVYTAYAASQKAAHVAHEFLVAIQVHDYAHAETLMFPAARRVTPQDRMAHMEAVVEQTDGKILSYGSSYGQYHVGSDGAAFLFAYPVTYEHGKGFARLSVVPTPAGWKVYGYNFQM